MLEKSLPDDVSIKTPIIIKHYKLSQLFYALGSLLSLFIVFSIYIPEFYFFFYSIKSGNIFTYVNAWDEQTYLSYLGAYGIRNTPGYYSLYLVSLLQELKIPGSIQNLLFDCILVPLTIYFTAGIVHSKINNKMVCYFYAIIILFSSMLLNYCNPLLVRIYGEMHLSTFMSGWDTYPSILRAPNPLFSYFILSFALYIFSLSKRKSVLLVPLVFLYYFVFQTYLYCLSVIVLHHVFKRKRGIPSLILFNATAFLIISVFAYVAFIHLLTPELHHQLNNLIGTHHIQIGRIVYFPLYTIIALTLLLASFPLGILEKRNHLKVLISLTLCSFFISNIQLVSGIVIEIKNFQDYGNSLLIGIIFIVFLDSLNNSDLKRLGTLFLLSLIAFCSYLVLSSQMKSTALKEHLNTISHEQLIEIKKSPLTSLVLDSDLAAKISYSQAKMPPLLTSYTMSYPFIFEQCSCFYTLAQKAQAFLQSKYHIKNETLDTTLESMKTHPFSGKDDPYCRQICPDTNQDTSFTIYQ